MADPYGDMSDLEVLDLDSGPPPDMMSTPQEVESSPSDTDQQSSPDTGESSYEESPSPETQETAEEPQQETQKTQSPSEQPEDDFAWAEPLLRNNPELAQRFDSLRDRLKTYRDSFGSVANARLTRQMVDQVGGLEAVKQLRTTHQEIEATDDVFLGGSYAERREYFANLRRQNPESHSSATMTGLQIIKQGNPEAYRDLTRPYVAEQLEKDFVWEHLEELNRLAERNGDTETLRRLNLFAGFLHKEYNLGPDLPESPEAAERRKALHHDVESVAGAQIDNGILERIQAELPGATQEIKAEIFAKTRQALLNSVRENKHLIFALRSSFRRAPSRNLGNRMVGLLITDGWPQIPRIVAMLAKPYLPKPSTTPANAKPSSSARKLERKTPKPDLSRMTEREMLDLPEGVVKSARATPQGMVMTKSQMKQSRSDFRKLLDDSITVVDG
jgi:hypothetical protein